MTRSIHKTVLTVSLAVAVCAAVAAAQIPVMRVTTQGGATPGAGSASSCGNFQSCSVSVAGGGVFTYLQMTDFELTVPGNALMNVRRTNEPDSIRRRGNSTSTADKRPFRIKFDKKVSLFGKEAARSWVLLANYYDPTFIHNAVAFELGKRLGLEYINSFQHVELYLNNRYRGIYLLTEQVQANPGRVDIDETEGWLVEFDFHTPDRTECDTWFRVTDNSTGGYCVTGFIKSPEDLPDASGYQFVKDDIAAFVNAVGQGGTAWRELIDFESFAKSILIIQAMQNVDFNRLGSNFAYKDTHHKRMYAGPLWDFDLCCGMPSTFEDIGPNNCRFPSRYCITDKAMKPQNDFYGRIWDDPAFRSRVKKVWDRHKADFDAIPAFMDSVANVLSGADFSSDGSCGSSPCASSASAHRSEINKFKAWWTTRMNNVNQQLSGFSTSNDIVQPVETKPVSSINVSQARTERGGRGLRTVAVRNGIRLNVADRAAVKIYGLDGRELRRVNLTRGNHTVRFGDMPKGVYMVRVVGGGEAARIVRVAVR